MSAPNYCSRCGKRLADGIHTCTPPADASPVTEQTASGATDDAILHEFRKGDTVIEGLRNVASLLSSRLSERDADRWKWLASRFAGYDFEWGDPPMICAVFEVDQDFRGGRDIGAAIDAAIDRIQGERADK